MTEAVRNELCKQSLDRLIRTKNLNHLLDIGRIWLHWWVTLYDEMEELDGEF